MPSSASLTFAALLLTFTVACGGGGDGGGGGGAGGEAGGTGGTSACGEADLGACEYESQGLSVTVREGFSVTDAITGRELPLLARIPEGSGPFPVVVWSHGGGFNQGGQRFSPEWGDALASHGYVVIHIAHIPVTPESGAAFCELGAIPPGECSAAETEEDTTGLLALVKTRDTIAVLDALPDLSAASVDMGGPAIDLERVAIAGWSAGARAPIVTHGAVFLPSPSAPALSMTHPLPKAAIALSPMGPGYAGFFDEPSSNTWEAMRGPVLVATGNNDIKPDKPDVSGEDRRLAFERQPADGSRWLLFSTLEPQVGGHSTYNLEDLESSDERLARLSLSLRSSALAFLDANLKGDEAAQAWLASQNAQTLAGAAEWAHR
jgi:dienelactone hydrolase